MASSWYAVAQSCWLVMRFIGSDPKLLRGLLRQGGHTKWAQFHSGDQDAERKLLKINGGRGWNRTTNLSIKSRMLCQLSYASSEVKRPNVEQHSGGPARRYLTP